MPEMIVYVLLQFLLCSMQLASCLNCNYNTDYVYTYVDSDPNDEFWLSAVCCKNQSELSWSVGEELFSSGNELIIDYQCNTSNGMQFHKGDYTRLYRVSLGSDFAEYNPGITVHIPNLTEHGSHSVECHYFGCYFEEDAFYLFNPVTCTFGEEATSYPPSLSPTSTSVTTPSNSSELTLQVITSTVSNSATSYPPSLSPTSTSVTTPSNSSELTLQVITSTVSNSASAINTFKEHTLSQPLTTVSSSGELGGSLENTVSVHHPNSTRPSSTLHTEVNGTPTGLLQTSHSLELQSRFFTIPLPSSSPAQPSRENDQFAKWISAVSVILGVALLSIGGLILIALRKHYLRMRQEKCYPLKVIPGLNDDKIDPTYSPVRWFPHPPRSPSTHSNITVFDEFDDSRPFSPQSQSGSIPFHLQELCDRALEFAHDGQDERFDVVKKRGEKDNLSLEYRSRLYNFIVGERQYVTIYPSDVDGSDVSGFSSEEHSYFSISNNEQPDPTPSRPIEFQDDHNSEELSSVVAHTQQPPAALEHHQLSLLPEQKSSEILIVQEDRYQPSNIALEIHGKSSLMCELTQEQCSEISRGSTQQLSSNCLRDTLHKEHPLADHKTVADELRECFDRDSEISVEMDKDRLRDKTGQTSATHDQ